MTAQILDGSATAKAIRQELKRQATELTEKGHQPKLAVVLIGDDPASQTYVKMKQKACQAVGVISERYALPSDATQQQAEELVNQLNNDSSIDGVLIQHPLPKQLDELKVLGLLDPEKDVDGITPASLGRLAAGIEGYRCCTPLGIMELLRRYDIKLSGKKVVVIGRSIILGKPMALLMLEQNATVTICHSRTLNLPDEVRQADVVVAAVGRAELVKGDWIKPGAVVIDAGYNRVVGRSGDVGDVDYAAASQVASYITPVPGGVGPMTIAMLMANSVTAAAKKAAQ
ncbi:MAG: bifunctional methylenetetrahydrofolate dehydrogenase/methenyltetrahydrofolate cyclohydrolase FolD [Armatimonadota bacterium]